MPDPRPSEVTLLLADTPFLGDDLIVWLLLALGAAMVAGNVAALLRPPVRRGADDLPAPPKGRSAAFVVLGSIVAVWALASLVTGR